jgi:HEAT repeat protein
MNTSGGACKPVDPHYLAYGVKKLLRESDFESIDRELVSEVIELLNVDEALELIGEITASMELKACPVLAEVGQNDLRWPIRNKALSLLASFPEARNEYSAVFMDSLGSEATDFISATSIKALGKMDKEITFGVFKKHLTHPDARVRANCIEGLRHRAIPGIGPVLTLLLEDSSCRVRAEAALSLWSMGKPVLLELLEDAEDPVERLTYISALGRTGPDVNVVNCLLSIYNGVNEKEAAAAAEALLQLNPEEMIPRFTNMAVSGPNLFRSRLFRKCLSIDKEKVVDCLIQRIDELAAGGEVHARSLANALSLLKEAGSAGKIETLIELLSSSDVRVAANAIEVLQLRVDVPVVRAALIRCMRSGTPRMRVNAAVALWDAGLVSAVTELKAMLMSDVPDVRAGSVYGLGTIGMEFCMPEVEEMLSDPADSVRAMAARFVS